MRVRSLVLRDKSHRLTDSALVVTVCDTLPVVVLRMSFRCYFRPLPTPEKTPLQPLSCLFYPSRVFPIGFFPFSSARTSLSVKPNSNLKALSGMHRPQALM